jgi:acyl carrier protein
MAVEDAFDIQIADADAEKMITPRQVIDFVLSKVTTTTASVCLTQRAFNLLRKSLIHQCGLKRSQITPVARLSELLPVKQRRDRLQQIMQELGIIKSPQLVRSRSVNAALLGSSLSAGIGGAIAACPELASLSVFVFIGVAIITASVGIRLTRPLCREFPKELQTVGDLARWVMTHKADLANATAPGWTREQITIRVREIIVEQLGVKPDFSEDAHFIKDLGMG